MSQLFLFKCAWCARHLSDPDIERQARSDKKFCNASCRGKFHRWKKGLAKHEAQAQRAIDALAGYLDHPIAQQDAARALVGLRKHIENSARIHGVVGVR